VELVSNGQEAVDRLRDGADDFDVVLMDVQMPVLGGLDATRQIRQALGLSRLPIIALTAGALGAEQRAAEAAGMNDFLSKPFDPPVLIRRILRHVHVDRTAAIPLAPPAHKADQPAWPAVDGIDSSDVCRRLGGDVELFKSMLRRLLKDFDDLNSGDDKAVDDLVTLAARMHNLKGTAGTLGAKVIYLLASQAEAASRAFNAERTAALSRALGEHLAALRSASATLFNSVDPLDETGQASGEFSNLRSEDLTELLALLRGFNLDATARFAALANQLRHRLGKDSFALVREHVESLQFDDAARLLDELQHEIVESVQREVGPTAVVDGSLLGS